jgi:hypothetical protein
MDIESIFEIIKPRPPFWIKVWLFFFLLINRKEGRRLFETLIEEVKTLEEISLQTKRTYQQVIENLKKSDAISTETMKKIN